MPKVPTYPAEASLDGTEIVYVVVDPFGSPVDKRATTQQIASLGGSGPGPTVTTLTGSVSGSAYCTQLYSAGGYKRVVITLVNWKSTAQAFTFPTPFASVAVDVANAVPAAAITLTAATLADNSAGTAVNAVIVIEGR